VKNLYSRLRVSKGTSIGEIKRAIERCPYESDSVDAQSILLDPNKRRVYDRHLHLLEKVAEVRKQTGLLSTGYWSGARYADFKHGATSNSGAQNSSNARGQQRSKAGTTAERDTQTRSPIRRSEWAFYVKAVLTVAAIIAGIALIDAWVRDNPSAGSDPMPPEKPWEPVVPEQPIPESGYYWTDYETNGGTLTVTVPYDSPYYLLKAKHMPGKAFQIAVFIKAGAKVKVPMPQGEFRIEWVYGDKWYGLQYHFGPNAHAGYMKRKLSFSNRENWQLMLQPVKDGNLQTYPLDVSDF